MGEVRRTAAGSRFHVDHRHVEVEFDLVVRGSGSFTLGDLTYELKAGTLIWLRPGQQHRLLRSPQLEMWVVTVRPELLGPDWITQIRAQPSRMLSGEELVELDRLLSQVAQDTDEPETYNAGVAYALKRALRASRESPPAHIKLMHPAVTRALLLLRESDAAMSLSDLAKATGAAAPYLSRLLVEHTNRSFVDWRNRIRLERFLENYLPGANLLSASLDAGFGSYARFHHVFSDTIGCTPSEWARRADPRFGFDNEDEEATGGYGIPTATNLSLRQRWLRLVPLIDPAVGAVLGKPFIDRLPVAAAAAEHSRQDDFPAFEDSFSAAAVERLLESLRARDPELVGELGSLIGMHDFPGMFSGVLKVFGLQPTQFPDAVTAFAMLLWVAIHGAADPGFEQAHAVNRQVRRTILGMPMKFDSETAREAHTALLCHFVVAYHALEAARASGTSRSLEQLRQAAVTGCREAFGSDMTDIKLTSHGFMNSA